jgi:hypothetical protein
MLKIRSYLIIAFVVYVGTLLSALPASLLTNALDNNVKTLQINNASGTVWNGRAQGFLAEQAFNLDWNLRLLELFLFRLSADIHLKADLLELKSKLILGYKKISVSGLSGLLKSAPINILLKRNGLSASISNDIYLKNITLERSSAQFVAADGFIDWNGGLVKVKDLPNGEIELPALQAKLANNNQGISVAVNVIESGTNLLDVDLSHQGLAHLKLKERISEYVEVPKQLKQGDPNKIMFEVKRQIFETKGKF